MNDVATDSKGQRDVRVNLAPLWRITGAFTLETPLHVGSGLNDTVRLPARGDEGVDTGAEGERMVAPVVRDHRGLPCIPGAGLKGALRALAMEMGWSEHASLLFGLATDAQETAGTAEFETLHLAGGAGPATALPNFELPGNPPGVAHITHAVRNRALGSAEDNKLYVEQVVPPGRSFHLRCTVRGANRDCISYLLGLLARAGAAQGNLRLGAGKSANNGKVSWQQGDVHALSSLAQLWIAALNHGDTQAPGAAADSGIWASAEHIVNITAAAIDSADEWLVLPGIELDFHTPFLVYEATVKQPNTAAPDGRPRRNHQGRGVLPASSLHGALRGQAERILRTLRRAVASGHEVAAVQGLVETGTLDLASVLFGAPGWRSLLRFTDFLAEPGAPQMEHHMLAIDRLTGGGKDGAKFKIDALDCPRMTGDLHIELRRLNLLDASVRSQALGLLAHVLRDLDEGDVALGYGAAKGYGACRARSLVILEQALASQAGAAAHAAQLVPLQDALAAFAALSGATTPSTTPAAASSADLTVPQSAADVVHAQADQGDFHNPYAFTPFAQTRSQDWPAWTELNSSAHSHAAYNPQSLHGRLICRLVAATPLFVGAGSSSAAEPKPQTPFRLGRKSATGQGEIALPATSLRGMVSALHEAITASRLRVAANERYSVRSELKKGPGLPLAIGRVVQIERQGVPSYWLQLMALPPLRLPNGGGRVFIGREYSALLRPNEPVPLKTLFGTLDTALADLKNHGTGSRSTFLMEQAPAPVPVIRRDKDSHFEIESTALFQVRGDFAIGLRCAAGVVPQPLGMAAATVRQRGVLRVMRSNLVERELSDTRKHEVFLPYSLAQEQVRPAILAALSMNPALSDGDIASQFHLLPIPQEVLATFHRLSDERTAADNNDDHAGDEALKPYHPIGRPRNAGTVLPVYSGLKAKHSARALRVQHNDLLYFRPNKEGSAIAEISYSSIWRRQVAQTTADWVPSDLMPALDADAALRLSPSELLFGQVFSAPAIAPARASARAAADSSKGRAFASKLRFGHGRWINEPSLADPVVLKILATPKPPSPALYLHRTDGLIGVHTAKSDLLVEKKNIAFNGRKRYLHALRRHGDVVWLDSTGRVSNKSNGGLPPWQTRDAGEHVNQKVQITPVCEGAAFFFEIEFCNLSEAELQALCAAVQPLTRFEHKLGMGKPIGLGSALVEPVGLFLLDRPARYRQCSLAVNSNRYVAVWKGPDMPATASGGLKHLAAEVQCAETPGAASPLALAAAFMARLKHSDPAVYNAIRLTGDPGAVQHPVHYPQLKPGELVKASKPGKPQQRSEGLIESQTYEWFVAHAETQAPGLAPIEQDTQVLPRLSRRRRQTP